MLRKNSKTILPDLNERRENLTKDKDKKENLDLSKEMDKDQELIDKNKKVDKIKKKEENKLFNFDELSLKQLKSISQKEKKLKDGKFINEALNNNVSSFIPDLLSENIVKNYKNAKQIYGEKILKYLTGYSSDYIQRNVKIPEFQKELKKRVQETINQLKKEKIITKSYKITKVAKEMAVASQLFIELDKLDKLLSTDNLGKYINKYKVNIHGAEKQEIRAFKKGDSYKDIALKSSIKLALRRNHKTLNVKDLVTFEKASKANLSIVYAIDSSSSMKGNKLNAARKSAISLAYKTLQDKNKLGLIDFSDKINASVRNTNFQEAINFIYKIKPNAQTDLSKAILHSIELFPKDSNVKHLMLLTDGMPTKTSESKDDPEDATLNAVAVAKSNNISVSIILIDENIQNEENIATFASKIIEVGNGKLYKIRNLDDLEGLVIDEYLDLI